VGEEDSGWYNLLRLGHTLMLSLNEAKTKTKTQSQFIFNASTSDVVQKTVSTFQYIHMGIFIGSLFCVWSLFEVPLKDRGGSNAPVVKRKELR
jgi:hypothetical protein